MFDQPDFDDHEALHSFNDRATGMRCIIALHSTHLGPGAGGCRFWRYPSTQAAITDALRLSRGMSYKNAMAGLPVGGGKAVLLAGGPEKSDALMGALGRAIDSLGGRYVTAEDVGMTPHDMVSIARATRHVAGLPVAEGEVGGTPSPATSEGAFVGMRAGLVRALGTTSFEGVHVAIQGVGAVGEGLAERLAHAGARLTLADIDQGRADALGKRLGAEVIGAEEIMAIEADVFSPNALGAILNPRTIPALKVKLIAGAANNQLETPEDGVRLHRRGILYAPDYVLNAGGIINVTAQYLGERDAGRVMAQVRGIEQRLGHVFDEAASEGLPPGEVADRMARRLIGRG